MSPTFKSLRHRNYRIYWSGMLVSNIGTWMQRIAQDWLVLVVLGGGAQAVGITTAMQFLPFLLLAPFGGLIADRVSKRHWLMLTNGFLGLVGLTLGVLVLTDSAQIWHVYIMAFLLGVGSSLDNPARQAFVSELVRRDDLTNAVALNSASFNAARLIGPAVAGVMIELIGTGWVFVVNGITFISPILALLALRGLVPEYERKPADGTVLARLGEGVSYVRSRPDIVMVLFLLLGLGTFGMNLEISNILMATEVFGKDAGEYGILGSILAVGTLAGALIAARRQVPRRRLIVGGAVVFGALEILAGLMSVYVLYAIALVPLGMVALTVLTAANAYVQSTVPLWVRGRVMALYMMIFMGGKPLGAMIIGWAAEAFGARWSLLGGGTLTILFAGVALVVFAPRSGVVVRPRMRPWPRLVVVSSAPASASSGNTGPMHDVPKVRERVA